MEFDKLQFVSLLLPTSARILNMTRMSREDLHGLAVAGFDILPASNRCCCRVIMTPHHLSDRHGAPKRYHMSQVRMRGGLTANVCQLFPSIRAQGPLEKKEGS